MTDQAQKREGRWIDGVGFACVIATLLLSGGVSAVRADSPDGALMSVDPALVAAIEAKAQSEIIPTVAMAPVDPRAGVPAAEVAPGVIQLNTRGYNYGPPVGEIDAAAIRMEPRVAPASKAPASN
jgi:hypothetical protein